MRFPLQYQIMLPLAAVALISLLAVAVIDAYLATTETRKSIDRQLQGVVHVLATSNFPLTDSVLRQMKELSGADFVLVDREDQPLATTLQGPITSLPKHREMNSSETSGLGTKLAIRDTKYFHSATTLQSRIGDNGPEVLHTLFPYDQYQAAWRRAFLPPLVVGILTIGAVAVVTHWIVGHISHSLAQLITGVSRLAQGENVRVELPLHDDEVRDLAVAINQTSDRLVEYEQQVRQTEQIRTTALLGAGLAHEIRNAATGCRLAIDLHAEKCDIYTEVDGLDVARGQLQLMENRLQRFLTLGRPSAQESTKPIDLNLLVEELIPLVLPAAKHAGIQLAWEPSQDPIKLLANSDTLSMVIVNLLLNAIEAAQKHSVHSNTPPQVELRVQQSSENHGEVLVCDSGEGPPTSVCEKLFQPFVSTKSEGIGLGLAVATQVAHAHGGTIDWCRQECQTVFRLRLPLMEMS